MTFNHRKKKTIRRKQRFSKRKSAKTHRRRRVRIMRGGSKEWKVTVYGTLPQTPGSKILYNNGTFTFDDTIDENATKITGNLVLPGLINVTLPFTQDEEDTTIYLPDTHYIIKAAKNISLVYFQRHSTAVPPPPLPPKQMYPLPLMPLRASTSTAAMPTRASTALPVASLKPYLYTTRRLGESSIK